MLRSIRLALVLCLFAPSIVHSQFSKGTRMAGASVANIFFNSGNLDQTVASVGSISATTSGYGVTISPSLGWFLSENTAVGVTFNLSPAGDKVAFEENGTNFQKDESTSFNISLGAFVRNYFKSSGKFLPFGQFSIDGGIGSRKTEGFYYGTSPLRKETYDGKSSGGFITNAIITLGLTKMMGENAGLDIYLGYNFYYSKNTFKTTRLTDLDNNGSIDETSTNEVESKYTNHRFILGIGFQVFLNKPKK